MTFYYYWHPQIFLTFRHACRMSSELMWPHKAHILPLCRHPKRSNNMAFFLNFWSLNDLLLLLAPANFLTFRQACKMSSELMWPHKAHILPQLCRHPKRSNNMAFFLNFWSFMLIVYGLQTNFFNIVPLSTNLVIFSRLSYLENKQTFFYYN